MKPYVNIEEAVHLLRSGEVVAIPTETVYGLAADATNDEAVAKIFQIKNRPSFNPLIVHVITLAQVELFAELNDKALKLAQTFWPGPLTIVLKQVPNNFLSKLACAGLDTVAIRIPGHTVMQNTITLFDGPIAAPSANPSLFMSPTLAKHVVESFKGSVPVVDGGPCHKGLESTIVDVTADVPVLLRPGPITKAQIEAVIGRVDCLTSERITAPGQMKKHYAPKKPVRLNATSVEADEGLLAFGEDIPQGGKVIANLSPTGNMVEAAANLFQMLHELDKHDITRIAVMPIPAEGVGVAINDRLQRAAEEG